MPRPVTKKELTETANANYEKLLAFIETMTEKELDTPFDFSSLGKKEAHWARDKNLRDVLVHLYEWHRLLLEWTEANLKGEERPFIPKPYSWKTYGDMNIEFWNKHQSTNLKAAAEMLKSSHSKVMALLDNFSDEELFTKGVYKWVGGSTLGSYFISVTSSHYDWALKKLRTHRKLISGKEGA